MKSLETANKGLKALAKKNPSLVEDKFGYNVPGYMMGGIAKFATGDAVGLLPGGGIPSMNIDIPNIDTGKDIDFSDVFDKDAQDEAEEDLEEVNKKEEEDKEKKSDMEKIGEMLSLVAEANDFSPLVRSQIIRGSQASIPQLQRFQRGGIAGFDFSNFDINDYLENILGVDTGEGTEEDMATALARAYGAKSGIGSLGYSDTRPGASITIDAKDVTPDVYRFYPSEVSKIYAQAKGVPFSPLVAPPREATFIDDLQPRRIAGQLYAKNGTFVERDQLVTGPGGEKGDEIPAMLSDGEFVTNSAAVRGMGIMAGADPQDEYEQRLMGAREMYKMQKFGEDIAKQLA